MPRRTRSGTGGLVFHAINRAAGNWQLFETDAEYAAFLQVLEEGLQIAPIRILAYCLMPNHWHLVVWPSDDEQLSEYMKWVSATHATRWHKAHGTTGRGALYQGRFKSFPVQEDNYFYTLCRYVERNALRARLVQVAENWRWSSLWQRLQSRADLSLNTWPLPMPTNWVEWVNQPQTEAELNRVRHSILHNTPLGSTEWCAETAAKLGQASHNPARGRRHRPE
jgi:putative transposase